MEAAVDRHAEASMQHSQLAGVAAGIVQVVGSGHYWEAVVVVESRPAPVLGSWPCLEGGRVAASEPAVAVAVAVVVVES